VGSVHETSQYFDFIANINDVCPATHFLPIPIAAARASVHSKRKKMNK